MARVRGFLRAMGWNLWVSQCCEVLPHVLVADDLDNGAGHLGAAQADPLQQWLQPPHIALHVRVQERQDVACGQKPRAPSGSHTPSTPQADGTTASHPGTSQNFSGKQSYRGGAGDPDGCLLTPSGARQPGLAPQDALLPATCEPPAPQLCSPEPLGRAVARCLLSTVSAEQFCSAVFSCPPRELSEGSQGELVQACGRASPYLWQPAPPPAWPVSDRASL